MARVNFKTRKVVKWVVIGTCLGILTLFTLLVLVLVLFLFGPPAYRTTNIKNYSEIYEKDIRSGLIIFPDEITEQMSDMEFSFYYKDTLNTPTVSIFLQCTYTPETYEVEVERLENTQKVYGGTIRRLLKDEEEKYPYEAYIAIENHHHQYEYALLTGEREITYIHTAYFDRDNARFDQAYLPMDYAVELEDSFYGGYSIYLKHIDAMFGGISYDNTKDENVIVKDFHTEWIEDSTFTVRVQLDEHNREIITDCQFSYYEPSEDLNNEYTHDEESDNTVFTDLAGYEYVDLKLSEDRTAAIVIYLDAGVEKEWQVELKQYMKVKEQ